MIGSSLSASLRWGRSVWGSDFDPAHPSSYFRKLARHGYHFVEVACPPTCEDAKRWREAAEDVGLGVVVQIHSAGGSPGEHAESLCDQLKRSAPLAPILVNSHTGRDFYTLDANAEICSRAQDVAESHGLALVHETHRSRATFSVPATAALLERLPFMRLCADFSHWCCVHESFLEDQQHAVNAALERADYLHLRVGHTQSPQITDPRVREWEHAVAVHLEWWRRRVLALQHGETLLVSPEFGPAPYMTCDPETNTPLVDLWEVNEAMRAITSASFAEALIPVEEIKRAL